MLETTAFYQKWICRSVRHFFSFFKIFQLCYVNFFNSGHVMVIFQLCSYPRMYVQIFSILSPMVPKLWTTVHLNAWCWLLGRQRETETLIKWSRAFYTPTLHTTCAPLTSCDKGESIKGPAPLNKSFSLSLSVKQSTSSSQMNCSKSHKKSHKLLKLKLNIIKVMIIANKQQNY